jgi:hypothetical protein
MGHPPWRAEQYGLSSWLLRSFSHYPGSGKGGSDYPVDDKTVKAPIVGNDELKMAATLDKTGGREQNFPLLRVFVCTVPNFLESGARGIHLNRKSVPRPQV